MMLCRNSRVFLLALVIWIPSSLFLTYTGTFAPESSLFAQAMNISAFLIVVVSYIRHCQLLSAIMIELSEFDRPKLLKYNSLGLSIGAIAALGTSIVGNFQADLYINTHMIGAFVAFFGFIFYCWIQTYISYKLKFILNTTESILIARLFLSALTTFNLSLMMGFGYFARTKLKLKHEYHWSFKDDGFLEHAISSFNEWSQIIGTTAYFLTFYPDFKHMKASNQEYMILEYTADA